ncbi:MAG: MoaD/ThiS family protein [Anaerolineaceae bacterium]|nr:MoaD/ThiS family protein [Anaerolineaceae bacterium]
MIRVVLPTHLRSLARTSREIELQVEETPSLDSVLNVLESQYPMLRGTIRDQSTKMRRPFIRFFICGEDWSHEPTEAPLPDAIVTGKEPLRVVGAMAGG